MTAAFTKLSARIRWFPIAALFAVQIAGTLLNRFRFLPTIEINLRGLHIFQRMTSGYTAADAALILEQLDLPAHSLYLRVWIPINLILIFVACAVFLLIFIKAWPRVAAYLMIPVALYLLAGIGETALTLRMLRGGVPGDAAVAFCSFLTRALYFLGDSALYVLAMIAVASLIIPYFAERRKTRRG